MAKGPKKKPRNLDDPGVRRVLEKYKGILGDVQERTAAGEDKLVIAAVQQRKGWSEYDKNLLLRIVDELSSRQMEALKLYEPLPMQEAFHRSLAPERVITGSNRSTKTTAAAVECARALTGQDPYGKYPAMNGRWFCVTTNEKLIGSVFHEKMFKPGAFKIIRDLSTGLWRAYRPWLPEDLARKQDARPAPPLIPKRFIKGRLSWYKKNDGIPRFGRLTTGWEVGFYSSEGRLPKGVDIDGAWFTEEVENKEGLDWYSEIAARLIDRSGKFFWDATPEVGTEQLQELRERALECAGSDDPPIQEFFFMLADNPHIAERDKQLFAGKLNEDMYRVKVLGEPAILGRRMFPEFNKHFHVVDYFTVPPDWTRYVAIDPGHQVAVATFVAVPPRAPPGRRYVYDELYINACNAAIMADRMEQKVSGQVIEAYIIDNQMARQTEIGSGMTIAWQYEEAFKAKNLRSRLGGTNFVVGSADKRAGIEAIRGLLRPMDDGLPGLCIMRDAAPRLVEQMRRHLKQVVSGFVTDEPARRNADCIDTLRYHCMYNEEYIRPPSPKPMRNRAAIVMQMKRDRMRQESGGEYIRLGSGG